MQGEGSGSRAWLERLRRAVWAHYLLAALGTVLVTAVLLSLGHLIDLFNVSLLYLVTVLLCATLGGFGPGAMAAVITLITFDWFFLPPLHIVTITNPRDQFAFVMFLSAAILAGHLSALARRRARNATLLHELSTVLGGSPNPESMLPLVARHLARVFGRTTCAFSLHETGAVPSVTHGASTSLPGILTVPLRLNSGRSGVLELTVVPARLTAEERQVLETLVTATALAIERDRLAEEERATMLARESDNLKRSLLAMVSHDLRTPLASIKATASGLLEDDVTYDAATLRQFLAAIDGEADRMLGLVSNLLDLSRIEAGALRPDAEWYEPEEVIGTAIGSLLPRLSGHHLVRAVASGLPLVRCDYVHLVQVLTNLLENAARYAPAGSTITLAAHARGEQVLITVSDAGPGVLPEERRQIFDAFVRGSAARATEVSGSGLGLAICKGLVEASGGRIWVDEAVGGGAAFTVALPALLTTGGQSVPTPLPEDEYASNKDYMSA